MTTENSNPAEMTDDELEAAQRLADSETPSTAPILSQDPDAANVTATAEDDKATDPTTPANAAAAPAVGADATDTPSAKVEGIASKDGSRILPYAALQAERRSARVANSRLESVTKELDDAKQLIADMKAGKTPENGEVTEADVAQMEEDFPEQGKKMRALFEKAQAAEANRPAPKAAEVESDDPTQEAIDQVPLLFEWQRGDAEKFERAKAIDAALIDSPKWRDKPTVARFEHVAKLVAEEFDIDIPAPKPSSEPKPTPSPANPAASAPRTAPNTLSDFKGGAVADHGTADLQKMAPTSLVDRFAGMSDADIDAVLARLG